MERYILIVVAWPYVNGDLHVGHLGGYLLPSDIAAKYFRLHGDNILMVSGSDCHGTPITIEADKQNVHPQKIVDKYHKKILKLFKLYNLHYNIYTLTHTSNHAKQVQNLFLQALKNGYITKKKTKQYYSPSEDRFLPDRYIEGTCPYCGAKEQRSDQCEQCGRMLEQGELINPVSKLSKQKVVLKETEHYFFNLDKLSQKLQKYAQEHKNIWKKWVYNETIGWIKEGLKARAITRDLDWGIEIPVNQIPDGMLIDNIENKRFYVWFDAVIGYLSAPIEWSTYVLQGQEITQNILFNTKGTHTNQWEKWWKNPDAKHFYFMGQDNLVFHTLMWPGMLIAANQNYTLPYNVVVNKFMNYEGRKFSKSRGWTIDSYKIAQTFGVDEVRFYMSYILPENKTGNFTWQGFKETTNNILVGKIGNLFHRVMTFIKNKTNGTLSLMPPSAKVEKMISDTMQKYVTYMEAIQQVTALNQVIQLAEFGNTMFDHTKPWEIKETQKLTQVLSDLAYVIIAMRYLLYPFISQTSNKLAKYLGLEEEITLRDNYFKAQYVFKTRQVNIGNIKPLFTKITQDPKSLMEK